MRQAENETYVTGCVVFPFAPGCVSNLNLLLLQFEAFELMGTDSRLESQDYLTIRTNYSKHLS